MSTTLAEKLGGPVSIQATVPGTGIDSSGGTVAFNSEAENQRAALLLENGHVVIGWGSHCDIQPLARLDHVLQREHARAGSGL